MEFEIASRKIYIFNITASTVPLRFRGPKVSVAGTQQTRQHATTKQEDFASLSSFRSRAFFDAVFD